MPASESRSRGGRGPPRSLLVVGARGRQVEQQRRRGVQGQAVGHHVVGAHDDRDGVDPVAAVVVRVQVALHDVQVPQRVRCVHRLAQQSVHEAAQLVVATLAGQADMAGVALQVEVLVVDPAGVRQVAGHRHDALAEAGQLREAVRHVGAQRVDRQLSRGVAQRRVLEEAERADLELGARRLCVEQHRVLGAERLAHRGLRGRRRAPGPTPTWGPGSSMP